MDKVTLMGELSQPKTKKVGRPQGSNREQTMENILRSALKCFTHQGFGSTSIKDVAKGAGLTPPAIYQYFGSKTELYAATLDGVYKQLLPSVNASLIEHDNLKEQLRGLLLAAVELHESNPDVTAFLSSVPLECNRHSALQSLFSARESKLLKVLCTMFDQAKSRGEILETRSTENLTMVFLSSAMGMALYHQGSQSVSMREAVGTFIDLIDNQLFI